MAVRRFCLPPPLSAARVSLRAYAKVIENDMTVSRFELGEGHMVWFIASIIIVIGVGWYFLTHDDARESRRKLRQVRERLAELEQRQTGAASERSKD